jgi:thymidylate synthase ThyX
MNKGSHGLAYTTLWIAGWKQDPSQWDNFFAVRTRNPTQIELQTAAKTMQQMMEE